jgi:hypothetical protein
MRATMHAAQWPVTRTPSCGPNARLLASVTDAPRTRNVRLMSTDDQWIPRAVLFAFAVVFGAQAIRLVVISEQVSRLKKATLSITVGAAFALVFYLLAFQFTWKPAWKQ